MNDWKLRRASVALCAFALAILLMPALSSQAAAIVSHAPAAQASRTMISFQVEGCDDCKIRPVQNRHGTITYWGPEKVIRKSKVSFRVPTARTRDMAFLVYAPFDQYAQDGIPMVVVTGFKAKKPGAKVTDIFASKRRKASGCWSGVAKKKVKNTLVVKRRKQHGKTVAAGWLQRTWKSNPYWWNINRGGYHASDPSICR